MKIRRKHVLVGNDPISGNMIVISTHLFRWSAKWALHHAMHSSDRWSEVSRRMKLSIVTVERG